MSDDENGIPSAEERLEIDPDEIIPYDPAEPLEKGDEIRTPLGTGEVRRTPDDRVLFDADGKRYLMPREWLEGVKGFATIQGGNDE